MKEYEEINNNIENIRAVVIDQLKNGRWKKRNNNNNLFYNEYFEVEYLRSSNGNQWWITFERSDFKLSNIMNDLYFYYFYIFYVKASIKKGEKYIILKQISDVSKKFFNKNTKLKRNKNLKDILT
jgi:hypothetical protein